MVTFGNSIKLQVGKGPAYQPFVSEIAKLFVIACHCLEKYEVIFVNLSLYLEKIKEKCNKIKQKFTFNNDSKNKEVRSIVSLEVGYKLTNSGSFDTTISLM